jgi:hypothetical protein
MKGVCDRGLHEKVYILAGVTPSYRQACRCSQGTTG